MVLILVGEITSTDILWSQNTKQSAQNLNVLT
jgi:hypothetical protein